MGRPGKLESVALAGMLLLPGAVATNASDAGVSDGYNVDYIFNVGHEPATCADLSNTCNTLLVNYSAGTVQFTLILPKWQVDPASKSNTTDYDGPGSEQLLAMDFLRGLKAEGEKLTGKGGLVSNDESPARAGKPVWAIAAATSMDYDRQQAKPDGLRKPTSLAGAAVSAAAGAPAFLRLQNVYEWEVDENVMDNGRYDISQLALSSVYLSPRKTDSTEDAEMVGCDPNEPSTCPPAAAVPAANPASPVVSPQGSAAPESD